MSSQVPPPAALFQHRPGVWIKESWLRFSGMVLQTRMVVLQADEGLALYSPSPATVDDQIIDEIREVGEPRWLIAPNEIHNVGVKAFQNAFPDVHTTGCVGHPRRVRDAHFDVLLDHHSAQDAVPWTAGEGLRFHVIGGNKLLHEIALLHVPSRTLVLTDAVECIHPERHLAGSPPGRALQFLMGRMGFRFRVPVMSPEHHALCVDPAGLRASLELLETWDFDSLVIAHGTIFDGDDARAALVGAFQRTLDAVESRKLVSRWFWGTISRFM